MGYTPPPIPERNVIIICGYCETQNRDHNSFCIACGGSLTDEITQRRNEKEIMRFGITVDEVGNAIRTVLGFL